MISQIQQQSKLKIKNFEQKVLNNSITDLLFYDKLADYLLQCCHAQAKPNTLSLFSFLPFFILSFIVQGPSTASFILTIVAIFIHQLLDIANKKQAYRLSSFSLSTFYIDHLFDSLSCTFLILIISTLLELDSNATLTAIYFFGMLPFYTHHLAMYNNDYLIFPKFSPNTQGLIILKLLFLIGAIYPSVFKVQISSGVCLYQIFIGFCSIWLVIFLAMDIKCVLQGKRVIDSKSGNLEQYPLKNIFVIFMLGYVIMEITAIQSDLLTDSLYFYFVFGLVTLLFAHVICNLVLAYGYNEKFKQISLSFLVVIGILIFYYFICAFIVGGEDYQLTASKVVIGSTFSIFLLAFLRQTWKEISQINSALS